MNYSARSNYCTKTGEQYGISDKNIETATETLDDIESIKEACRMIIELGATYKAFVAILEDLIKQKNLGYIINAKAFDNCVGMCEDALNPVNFPDEHKNGQVWGLIEEHLDDLFYEEKTRQEELLEEAGYDE